MRDAPSARRVEAAAKALDPDIFAMPDGHREGQCHHCDAARALQRAKARAAIAASDAALEAEGMVIVPTIMTEMQLRAASRLHLYIRLEEIRCLYQVAIAAAPGRSEPT